MVEMLSRSINLIGQKRAARAAFLPIRPEHEVVDDKLGASVEQIGK
jgi:hypothetical protein